MFRREIRSKRGSLPPKEGDLTCMLRNKCQHFSDPHCSRIHWKFN